MNLDVTQTALPGGYDYYCDGCDLFFSVSADKAEHIKYCPVCGWEALIHDQETLEKDHPLKAGRVSA